MKQLKVSRMSETLANLLDLTLAWRRVKADIANRVFIKHPFELHLIESNLELWLNAIQNSLRTDQYRPGPLNICDIPKGEGLIRPGAHLSMVDRVVYGASVGAYLTKISEALSWAQGTVDFSYRLWPDSNRVEWFQNQFVGWQQFRNRSLSKISEGIPYVVFCDISAYYENIDLHTLISDLREIEAPTEAIDQPSMCLNRWSQVNGRGIPQGHSPSDILGKLYLNTVDRNLQAMGYIHYRYVDDIRIFCRNLVEAKKALVDLSKLLRKRGLNLQSAKSKIYRAREAKVKIEGVASVISAVRTKVIDEALELSENPYLSLIEAEAILASNPDDPPIEIVRETYKSYFIDSTDSAFDKTLFRFLLKRLGNRKDEFAVEHCETLLERQPQETHTILDYFSSCEVFAEVEAKLVQFLNSEDAVYPYQIYQIIDSLCRIAFHPSANLMGIARKLAFDSRQPPYLRSVCRSFLGYHGSAADLELLEHSYPEASNQLEQSELICCVARMEISRRNAFFARAQGDGELNRIAVNLVKNGAKLGP